MASKLNKVNLMSSSLFHANFPRKLESISQVSDFMGEKIIQLCEDLGKPMFIYMANGKMTPLENIRHSKNVQKYLEEQGVHVYLYEPICSYYTDDPDSPKNQHLKKVEQGLESADQIKEPHNQVVFNSGFYSEFPNHPVNYRAVEFDSIYKYAEKNNLTNITVHSCDYAADKFYKDYADRLTFVYDDLYLNSAFVNCSASLEPKTQFNKKFINLNWRFTPFRAIISSLLSDKSAHLSWYFRCQDKHLRQVNWLRDHFNENPALYKKIIKGLSQLNQQAPRLVDLEIDESFVVDLDENWHSHYYPNLPEIGRVNPSTENNHYNRLENIYRETFVDVVSETRYAQPTSVISEKVLQSMQYLTPFILVAPPKTLECLKKMGFKTFSKWWDESYDKETNHAKRLEKINDLITYIDGLSNHELLHIYQEMYPVLVHNLKNLSKITDSTMQPIKQDLHIAQIQWAGTDENMIAREESQNNNNKEKILLINGCSHTAGSEIDGTEDSKYNRDHSYGNMLAQKLGIRPINISLAGQSNPAIARGILDWFQHEYDADTMEVSVCIGWTESIRIDFPSPFSVDYTGASHAADRYCKYTEDFLQINAGWSGSRPDEKEIIEYWQDVQARYPIYLEMVTINAILQMQYFLKMHGVEYIMCNTMHLLSLPCHYYDFYLDLIDQSRFYKLADNESAFFWYYKNLGYENPKAKYWHHGEEPHELQSQRLYEFFKSVD